LSEELSTIAEAAQEKSFALHTRSERIKLEAKSFGMKKLSCDEGQDLRSKGGRKYNIADDICK
jgi:hypothetical protein